MNKKNVGQRFSEGERKPASNQDRQDSERKILKRTPTPRGKSYREPHPGEVGKRPYSGDESRRGTGEHSSYRGDRSYSDRSGGQGNTRERNYNRDRYPDRSGGPGNTGYSRPAKLRKLYTPPPHPEGIRINRYIAAAGVCSRRDADKLVESGEITVNGVVVDTLGARIDPGDIVAYKGIPLKGEKQRYVLLNKPKGYITTNDDPEGRPTVLELISQSCEERLFPVGRLDMNTTGVLLFTNDGILAEKLMHPRNVVKKLYHVKLDKPITKEHMKKITSGIRLEDGKIKADQIAFVGNVPDNTEVGLEIHSGKNRIVRRIFEHLGYDVVKLDRVMFAGLTKKDLRRGKWRHLHADEVNYLKML